MNTTKRPETWGTYLVTFEDGGQMQMTHSELDAYIDRHPRETIVARCVSQDHVAMVARNTDDAVQVWVLPVNTAAKCAFADRASYWNTPADEATIRTMRKKHARVPASFAVNGDPVCAACLPEAVAFWVCYEEAYDAH